MQHERNTKEIDRIGSIGILINNKTKTEMISFTNGGPHSPAMRIAVKPVDYKSGELSNVYDIRSFITSSSGPFFYKRRISEKEVRLYLFYKQMTIKNVEENIP